MTAFPQLDFSTYPSQVFWLLVTFSFLYLILSRRVIPRIAEVLESRQTKIASDMDRAAELKTEAVQVKHEYEVALHQARQKANALVQQAAERIAAMQAERSQKLEESLSHQLQEAESRIAELRVRLEKEMQTVASDVATAIIEKFLSSGLEQSKIRAATDKLYSNQ